MGYTRKHIGDIMNVEDEEILEEYLENCIVARNNALHEGKLALFIYYQGEIDIVAQILTDKCDTKEDSFKGVA